MLKFMKIFSVKKNNLYTPRRGHQPNNYRKTRTLMSKNSRMLNIIRQVNYLKGKPILLKKGKTMLKSSRL
jgi:hypothetical protein